MHAPRPTRRTWTPPGKPERVTPERPRRKPAPGAPPVGPLRLPSLPPRALPSRPPAPGASPSPAPETNRPPAPEPSATPSGGSHPLGRVASGAPLLGAAALLASSAAAYRRESVQARLDLGDAEFAELVAEGTLLEVRLGRGARYVLAEALERPGLATEAVWR